MREGGQIWREEERRVRVTEDRGGRKRDEEQRDIKKGESHRCTKCTIYIFDAQKKRKLSMVR